MRPWLRCLLLPEATGVAPRVGAEGGGGQDSSILNLGPSLIPTLVKDIERSLSLPLQASLSLTSSFFGCSVVVVFVVMLSVEFNAHGSTPAPVFLTSRDETQTMVQAKLRPKLRPRQTLYLPGKGETQTMV